MYFLTYLAIACVVFFISIFIQTWMEASEHRGYLTEPRCVEMAFNSIIPSAVIASIWIVSIPIIVIFFLVGSLGSIVYYINNRKSNGSD